MWFFFLLILTVLLNKLVFRLFLSPFVPVTDAECLCNQHLATYTNTHLPCARPLPVSPKPSFLLLWDAGNRNFTSYSSPLPAGFVLYSAHKRPWREIWRQGEGRKGPFFVCVVPAVALLPHSSWSQPLLSFYTPRTSWLWNLPAARQGHTLSVGPSREFFFISS